MKKVLVIAPYAYLPWRSGGQKFIGQFLHYLGTVTDLQVISVAANEAGLARGYRLYPLLKASFSRYYDTSLVSRITAFVQEHRIDTVIWEHPYYAWLAFRIRKRTGVRTLIHTHNIEYQRFRSTGRWWWPILRWYERRCFRKADGIFFITPEDRRFATGQWKIDPGKCFDLPFGVELAAPPAGREKAQAEIRTRYQIGQGEKILLFTGALAYKPNLDALRFILDKINPLLLSSGLSYRIIICGNGLPAALNNLETYRDQRIIFAGFAEDIGLYYKAADVFLNPVLSGGGVKTKMVESIAYGTTVVSTRSGAAGMLPAACGEQLITVEDHNWKAFAEAVVLVAGRGSLPTPQAFYDTYHWEAIVRKIMAEAI